MFGPCPLSFRRLLVLVKGLGPDSRYRVDLGDTWTHDREVAAATLEVSHATYRATIGNLRVRDGSSPPEPLRVQRPGQEAPKPRRSLLAQMRAAMKR